MKINISPRLTSNNFNINDFEIDEKVLNIKSKIIDCYSLDNVNAVKTNNILNLNIIDNNKYGIINFNLVSDLVESINIDIDKDSNYLIDYSSKNNCLHNGIIKVNVKDNVKANIIVINNLNSESINLIKFENNVYENSTLNYLIVDLGGNTSISNYYTKLIGNNSKNNLNSIYIGNKNQVFDINYLIDAIGKNTLSNIDVQGSLKDEARKNFKGTIDFKRGCKGSTGSENEYCILLSDKSISRSLPMLLCTEEDVVGNHATASGKVNDKTLFYIMSRGISKKDAEKLIVKSNLNNLLSIIKDNEIKEKIEKLIDKKL